MRLQLALNVDDLDAAIEFDSRMFAPPKVSTLDDPNQVTHH